MIELRDDRLGVHFLVDCGAQQGVDSPSAGGEGFAFEPRDIQFVLLTHAHADHCGRLPELVRQGFRGPVYCSEATRQLACIALSDAARQKTSSFGQEDVDHIQWNTRHCEPYARHRPVATDLWVQPHRSSHLLGSVSWSVNWGSQGKLNPMLAFSGDVGPHHEKEDGLGGLLANNHPPHAPAESVRATLVLESTYGLRQEPLATRESRRAALLEQLLHTIAVGGKLLLPTFALGRTQEVLFDLYVLKHITHPEQLSELEVYTPGKGMAYKASQVYSELLFQTAHRKKQESSDVRIIWANRRMFSELGLGLETPEGLEQARALTRRAFGLEAGGVQLIAEVSELESFARREQPGVFVSPAGMGDTGLMAHAIRLLVEEERATIAAVGYASRGTLLSRLWELSRLSPHDKARSSDPLWPGEPITSAMVRARFAALEGYGGHASTAVLERYLNLDASLSDEPSARRHVDAVYLVHGEEHARRRVARLLNERLEARGLEATIRLPRALEWFELEDTDDQRAAALIESLRAQLSELSKLSWSRVESLLNEFRERR